MFRVERNTKKTSNDNIKKYTDNVNALNIKNNKFVK